MSVPTVGGISPKICFLGSSGKGSLPSTELFRTSVRALLFLPFSAAQSAGNTACFQGDVALSWH